MVKQRKKTTSLLATIFLSWTMITPLSAQVPLPVLKVATTHYSPPFVMESSSGMAGFDIDIIQHICDLINRKCEFHPMRFDQLLPAVANEEMDVAINAIYITLERAKQVNFSLPYLLGRSRFMGLSERWQHKFSMASLNNSKIGIIKGTIYAQQIHDLGIVNPQIVEFTNVGTSIEELISGNIDFILNDGPSTIFWQQTSNGKLLALGEPIASPYGLGIVVNKKALPLLKEINQALLDYQKSDDFKKNYQMYANYF